MISQPRIAVLGLSQPYVIYRTCLLITSSSCTRVRTYLRFKLRFKPSAYLYLRIGSKTKDRYLGLLPSLLRSDYITYADMSDCLISFPFDSPHCSPCTIRSSDFLVACTVRYDLVVLSCTISISEPLILRYLVLGEFRSLST